MDNLKKNQYVKSEITKALLELLKEKDLNEISIREITTYKWIIKKSEFICTLIPCNDPNDIDTIIHQYQDKYHDATHNCIAYIVGNQKKANDNGEPSGTAGLPMLDVLEKNELTNIIAIVTRYFGGIKLGAGGLTRAYRQSVADALKMNARKVHQLLKTSGILNNYIIPSYDVLHTFSKEYLVEDVVSLMKEKGVLP